MVRWKKTGKGFLRMTYQEMFGRVEQLLAAADASGIGEHLAFQFNITGEGAGAFYLEVKEGRVSVQPYEYRDRDALFTCSAETLFKIAQGKTDPVAAVMLGKLRVEGNIEKALRLKQLLGKAGA